MKKNNFVFFGSSQFSCLVLDELFKAGFIPSLIVATPSKPSGRKLALTPPPTKIWADLHSIPCLQPEKLKDESFKKQLEAEVAGGVNGAEIFIVASYGKIIPKEILNISAKGALNVHPSLLPKLRGATPIQSAILREDKTGVTIILLDEKVDHGPILGQVELDNKKFDVENGGNNWPPYADVLEEKLGKLGGELLAKIIPDWVNGKIKAEPQRHNEATFTEKITKEDGLIDLSETKNAIQNFRKIRAYAGWPNAYFFTEHKGKKIRVVVKEAELLNLADDLAGNSKLKITKVIPEGKKEMSYEAFLRGIK